MKDIEIAIRISTSDEKDFQEVFDSLHKYSSLRGVLRNCWNIYIERRDRCFKEEGITEFSTPCRVVCPVEAYIEACDLFKERETLFLEQIIIFCCGNRDYQKEKEALA